MKAKWNLTSKMALLLPLNIKMSKQRNSGLSSVDHKTEIFCTPLSYPGMISFSRHFHTIDSHVLLLIPLTYYGLSSSINFKEFIFVGFYTIPLL